MRKNNNTRSSSWEMYSQLKDAEKRLASRTPWNSYEEFLDDKDISISLYWDYPCYGEGHRHNRRAW